MDVKGKQLWNGELDWEAELQNGGVTGVWGDAKVEEDPWPRNQDKALSEVVVMTACIGPNFEGKRRGWSRRKRRIRIESCDSA